MGYYRYTSICLHKSYFLFVPIGNGGEIYSFMSDFPYAYAVEKLTAE